MRTARIGRLSSYPALITMSLLADCASSDPAGGKQSPPSDPPVFSGFSATPYCARSGATVATSWSVTGATGCRYSESLGSSDPSATDVPVMGSMQSGRLSSTLGQGSVGVICWNGAEPAGHQCSGTLQCKGGYRTPQICSGTDCASATQSIWNTDEIIPGDFGSSDTPCQSTYSGPVTGSGGGSSQSACDQCIAACQGLDGCCTGDGCICSGC
jgi:hypothetical protein